MNNLIFYVLLFFCYSILGWIMEVSCKLISDRKFINRGFLIGPWCPIYGCGGLLITLLLNKYINDPITLFIMAILVCSILEYSTSYVLEKLFNARWWDYNHYRFNINGRICLETMIPFGLLGLFIMYVSNPFLINIFNNIPSIILYIICSILSLLFILDYIVSFNVISKISKRGIELQKGLFTSKDNTEKITKMVYEEIIKRKKKLQKRVMDSFPNFEFIINRKK